MCLWEVFLQNMEDIIKVYVGTRQSYTLPSHHRLPHSANMPGCHVANVNNSVVYGWSWVARETPFQNLSNQSL
jgi:hypothetical protein